jgi:hypothetical protein
MHLLRIFQLFAAIYIAAVILVRLICTNKDFKTKMNKTQERKHENRDIGMKEIREKAKLKERIEVRK